LGIGIVANAMEIDAIMISKRLMKVIMRWYVVDSRSRSADLATIAMIRTEDMADVEPEIIGKIKAFHIVVSPLCREFVIIRELDR
jgi:hypothetical protein